ncbi:Dihydroneopterin aldolase-domain-containing protein [Xylaria nigripes]|nr:Dihydroneopterin aldolase-domain-containing protein [Xylaria nigripes]
MLASQVVLPPGVKGLGSDPHPAAPLASTWKVRAEAGEPQAMVRVRNLQSIIAAGRDAWGRSGKSQPVLLSSEVSFARPFDTASANDALNAETVHYGTLSKTLLGAVELFSPSANAAKEGKPSPNASVGDVIEVLWAKLTGRAVDGSTAVLPPDQTPFLDAARLRSLSLTLHLTKASLLGSGVSLTTTASFAGIESENNQNPFRSYARCLRLHGLHIPTLIGVNTNERGAKQMIVVDVEIDRFDAREDVHVEIEKIVVETVEASSFETLEALGTHVANTILDGFRIGDSSQTVRASGWQIIVRIEKPIAVPFADCPIVEVRVDA